MTSDKEELINQKEGLGMKQRKTLKGICILLCTMLLCSNMPVQAEDEQIKISEKEYAVTVNDALNLFLSNEKPISGEIGSKVFLTYTVEKVTKNAAIQSGLIGTMDNTLAFPYDKGNGRMYLDSEENGSRLYEEGYTYVFRFERTENGFEYQAAKLKGEEATPIMFASSTSVPESEAYKYYGTWIGGREGDVVSAVLNHVRCYDEKGNDLGVTFNVSSATRQDQVNKLFDVHPIIDSSYSFSLDNVNTFAISNKYPAKTDVVYMEYEVENITQDDTYQQGLIASNAPTATYPFADGKGLLQVKIYEKGQGETPLLREGGKYFVCFQKKEDGFDGIVQCTVNGKTEKFSFAGLTGSYNSSYPFFSLWYGEGQDFGVTADFKNVKCYDSEGNSLGIQLNKVDVPITHKGGIEDYSASQAVYYSEANNVLISLEDEQQFVIEKDGAVEKGTYTIQGDTDLYLLTEDGKTHYNYQYVQLQDEDGNSYKRMQESTVRFVTGEENFEVVASAETGFRVTEPEAPTKEGNTFKGWYLGDETAFDFDTVISESITLYAMWEDGEGNQYLAVDKEANDVDLSMIVGIAASAVILAGSVAGCIIIGRRRKHGSIR